MSMISLFAAVSLFGAAACGGDEPGKPDDVKEPVNPNPPSSTADINSVMTDLLDNTSCFDLTGKRKELMNEVQKYCDACSKADYDAYYKLSSASQSAAKEKGTILGYYKQALDRVVKEVSETQVEQGKVLLWHLYNMGYVVKTPSHCFGIDLKHKDAAKLVPYIEFLCITHKHSDHYSDEMNDAMKVAGKPVYSNFLDNAEKITGSKKIKPASGIEMSVSQADHSAELKNFCVTYSINCGADAGNKIIYHIGDTYNATQLVACNPDIFIVHGGINMNFTQAFNKVNPKVTLISHIDELSHAIDNYRWPFSKAFSRVSEWSPRVSYIPVWGEKIEF